ncbi:MAG: glycosyltransferase, partial [Candidatus Omnitrophica bacterium]|nr:glycosyltransferase [Candidatus Omnitrophota bacterium]
MRILMVHPHDIHSSSEPWTRRIKSIAAEVVRQGHEVKLVYFPLSPGVKKTVASPHGYEEIPLPRKPSPGVFIFNTVRLLKLAKWADVVHFQKCHHYSAVPSVAAAFLAGKPLHYDWDDWEEMIWYESCGRKIHSRFIGVSFKLLEKILPAVADSVSVASRHLYSLAVSRGAREERIYFAPVGADVSEFNPLVDRTRVREQYAVSGPLVLYIGQLHGAQYIDLFIHAAHILAPLYPDARFMIVGEGFMEGTLKRLADELGLSGRVIFTGSVRHDLIPFYIRAADVCVAPF